VYTFFVPYSPSYSLSSAPPPFPLLFGPDLSTLLIPGFVEEKKRKLKI
jgi:hypothetical protein